uniref:Oxidoreductase n=1 Tax=Moniliophthora roreri TaxID=221103 RepID=A0A0W0F8R7_MONRR
MFSKKWNPAGLHVYITGGSTGLGLTVAVLMVQHEAHVSIVARNKMRLDDALAELEKHRRNPSQKLKAYSFVLDTATESSDALKTACEVHGGLAPDAIIACAGASTPKFFVEMSEQDLSQGMVNAYWVQAWTAWAGAKMMVRQKRTGKIVLVSSTLGFLSFVGYASYAPGKQALRALGDTLQSELMLYDIDVHTFFPPTMVTNGYLEENKTKPVITADIEGIDAGLSTEASALALLKGIQNKQLHIAGDVLTHLLRSSTRGAAPRNNFILDMLYDAISWVGMPIWRTGVDKKVRNHREEHQEYLRERGFFDS